MLTQCRSAGVRVLTRVGVSAEEAAAAAAGDPAAALPAAEPEAGAGARAAAQTSLKGGHRYNTIYRYNNTFKGACDEL